MTDNFPTNMHEQGPPPGTVTVGETLVRVIRDESLGLLNGIQQGGGVVISLGQLTLPENADVGEVLGVLAVSEPSGGLYLALMRHKRGLTSKPECALVNLARLGHMMWHALDGSTCMAGELFLAGEDPHVERVKDYRPAKDARGETAADHIRYARTLLENLGVQQDYGFRTYHVDDAQLIHEYLARALRIVECGNDPTTQQPATPDGDATQ
jgi:hypothetical protein